MDEATIQIIAKVEHHDQADRLDICTILGYECITGRDQYKVGDTVIYIAPDNVLPIDQDWATTYLQYAPKRIRAIKLRNRWSEGLIVPLTVLPKNTYTEGDDVSEILGVTHYEAPQPQDLSAKGNLPYGIPKTDETRLSGMRNPPYGEICNVTRKADGSSCSVYYHLEDDKFGIMSRSLELKPECTNRFTTNIEKYDLRNKLTEYCKKHNVSLCIRGEAYGGGINGHKANVDSKLEAQFAMFSVWNITEHRYYKIGEEHYFENVANEMGIPHVPILERNVEVTKELVDKYALEDIGFEGVVLNYPKGTCKVINKLYDSRK